MAAEAYNYNPIAHFFPGLRPNGSKIELDIRSETKPVFIPVPDTAPPGSFIIGAVGPLSNTTDDMGAPDYQGSVCVFRVGENTSLKEVVIQDWSLDNPFIKIAAHELFQLMLTQRRGNLPLEEVVLKAGDGYRQKGTSELQRCYLDILPTDGSNFLAGILTPKSKEEYAHRGY